jgi:hypothetical protein
MTKRSLKERLEESPWFLAAGVVAAVLTFLIEVADKGVELYEKVTTKPPAAVIEVASARGYHLVSPTERMKQIPVIQQLLDTEQVVKKLLIKPPAATGKVALWPVQLLVLNPTEDRLNLWGCRMTVSQKTSKFPIFAFGYFVSESLDVQAKDYERLIVIEPGTAQHVHVVFPFSGISAAQEPPDPSLFEPAYLHISCKDQLKRELRTSHPVYSRLRAQDGFGVPLTK